MSLLINPDRITGVLLLDGWHDLEAGTFDLDSYEFGIAHDNGRGPDLWHAGGAAGITATGFAFTPLGTLDRISGPLTAILAVRELPDPFAPAPRLAPGWEPLDPEDAGDT